MANKTAITNVLVFDGHDLSGPATVVIDGGLIATADDPGDVASAAAATVIDGSGCTLLPGFFDCHVHANTEENLGKFPGHGITTVLDMAMPGDVAALRAAANRPGSGMPTYRSAGIIATHPDSRHAKMFRLADGLLVREPADAGACVAARQAAGSDYLKIVADIPGLDEPTMAALVDAAHKRGMLAIAHAVLKPVYESVARAGVDVVTHVPFGEILDDETVAMLKDQGRVCVPTLVMMELLAPRSQRPGVVFEKALANFSKMHAAGITICAGTDANELPSMAMPLGSSLLREFELMARGGMSNLEILRSATSVPAAFFGFDDRGWVKDGFRADLLLVEGNPVEDLGATKKPKKVWIGGVEAC